MEIRADVRAKALADLEWGRVERAIAGRCRGPMGARLVLPMAADAKAAARHTAETGELLRLIEAGDGPPLEGLAEQGPALQRAERGGALAAIELRDLMRALGAARVVRRYLSARKEQAAALYAACAFDPTLDGLRDELAACVAEDGTVLDSASPELRRLRGETANLRGRIIRRLEEMIHKHSSVLQDGFHTLREGRYVLPVRRDTHEKLPGIVHGTSASGATVFVEPRALVAQGNRLKMAQGELEREEARILEELTTLVRERMHELRAALDSLDHVDMRQASARFGRELGGRMLTLVEDAEVSLVQARHPLLVLDGVEVVPCTLAIGAGRALVLSGPNAGGKTVALKTLGVAALFLRAGVPFPCEEGSRCGFYADVLTDVGDDQSIAMSLSTFSAHITNLAGILRACGPRALILLDELAGGTDPQEGAALACALIDAFCRKGATTAVTTHYEPLKAMATQDARLDNAAVGFDVESMLPTFELLHGVPGASSALSVARRFGIPAEVLETARQVLPEQSRTFDELVRELEHGRRELALAKAEFEDQKRSLDDARATWDAQLEQRQKRAEASVEDEAKKARAALRRVQEELRKARKDMRKASNDEELQRARERVRAVENQIPDAPRAPAHVGAQLDDVSVGDRVYVPHLRSDAVVVDAPSRGKVRVAAGALKLWVDAGELRAPAGEKPAKAPARRAPEPREPGVDVQSSDNTLDLRGMRVDDALSMAEGFLDRMYGESVRTAYLLHGIGTGALRDALRERFDAGDCYVSGWRTGTTEEGGDRLTVVTLS